ncbi:MAG: o-succinylbenzoate--CoA ligase [Bacteroidetes bacterium QS_3_64_15]|nr:MAG: o-succinylbenzoate--CoA ligase [Bacteroidetes bacterium QS_3_64_15]
MPAGPAAPCPVHRHAQARPRTLALWTPERRWTYAELDASVAATCVRLRDAGLPEENRVALRLHRGPDLVILLWALWRTGRVAMPLSTRLPAAEVRRTAQRMEAKLLVTRDSALLDGESDPEACTPDRIVEREGGGDSTPGVRPIHRRASLIFTSGSTGTPSAVLHSWANHLYSAKGSNANLPLRPERSEEVVSGLRPGDRWLLSLPPYHVGGLAILVRCALSGAAVAIPDRDAFLSAALGTTGATHLSLVATQLRRLLDAQDGSLPPRVRGVLLGGGPLPEALLRRGHARGWPLHTSYGSTEMASQVTATPPGAPLADLRTAGRCLPHRRLRIDDDGEILVAGPTLCRGIDEAGQVRDPRVNGWFPTGDLGRLDAQGRLHVQGRVDRQFVSGGENIRPEEIEAALERLDGIERAVVVPVPDEEYGRRPVAFVRLETGRVPDDWRASLATVLPRFKLPDAVHRLPDAAVQDRMKVDRELLRRRAQE